MNTQELIKMRERVRLIVDNTQAESTADLMAKVSCELCRQCKYNRRHWWLSVLAFGGLFGVCAALAVVYIQFIF